MGSRPSKSALSFSATPQAQGSRVRPLIYMVSSGSSPEHLHREGVGELHPEPAAQLGGPIPEPAQHGHRVLILQVAVELLPGRTGCTGTPGCQGLAHVVIAQQGGVALQIQSSGPSPQSGRGRCAQISPRRAAGSWWTVKCCRMWGKWPPTSWAARLHRGRSPAAAACSA